MANEIKDAVQVNENQNITLAVLSTELKNISEKIVTGFDRNEGIFKMFEEKNCRKHQEILETTNKYRGELEAKMEQLKERMFTVDQYYRFLESNNGKLKMIDDRITNACKDIDRVDKQQVKLLAVFSIIIGGIIMGANVLIDIIRKKLNF